MGLATEMLREQTRRTCFWEIAFWVTLAAAIIKSVAGKAGQRNDGK